MEATELAAARLEQLVAQQTSLQMTKQTTAQSSRVAELESSCLELRQSVNHLQVVRRGLEERVEEQAKSLQALQKQLICCDADKLVAIQQKQSVTQELEEVRRSFTVGGRRGE